jgi:uncharacterized membrane protein YphA (DoxX/SURF4 family)
MVTRDRRFRRMALALAGIRITAGLYWLTNALFKLPPNFGGHGPESARHWIAVAAAHGIDPGRWIASELAQPHPSIAGWIIFLAEAAAGVSLVLGLYTRAGAVLGTICAAVALVMVGAAPGGWIWGHLLLLVVNVVPLVAPANAWLSLDAARG